MRAHPTSLSENLPGSGSAAIAESVPAAGLVQTTQACIADEMVRASRQTEPDRACQQLPFAHLNLRRNPFGEFTAAERTALAVVDGKLIDAIQSRLNCPRHVVQFLGEKGFGKTTHLLTLKARFPQAGFVHIPEGQTGRLPRGTPVIVDESQRLTRWQRARLFRRSIPLILGTHEDHTDQLRRLGRTVETIPVQQNVTLATLHQVFRQRIEWVRRGEGPVPQITWATTRQLQESFGCDVRSMLAELYHLFQSLQEIRPV